MRRLFRQLIRPAVRRSVATRSLSSGQGLTYGSLPSIKESDLVGLHNIANVPGAHKRAKRKGRGPGSGLGKTAGRGHKGQRSRSGGKGGRRAFEGGQTPLHRKLPKFGFKNVNRIRYDVVNCDDIVTRIKQGRIDPTRTIDLKQLHDAGLVNRMRQGVKLLSRGLEQLTSLDRPLDIEVSHVSKTARRAVEEIGGSVTLRFFSRRGLRGHLRPHKFHPEMLPGPSIPPPRLRERYLPYMEEELLEFYPHLYTGDTPPDVDDAGDWAQAKAKTPQRRTR